MNQYIYLKGKLVGPVEMEEPSLPRKSEDGNGLQYVDPHQKNIYNNRLKAYKAYLESLPSIEVHESLKSKLVEGKRYVENKDFQILKIDPIGLENDNTGIPTACLIEVRESPQPERTFTLQEMKEAFQWGELHSEYINGKRKDSYCGLKQYFKQTYNIDIQ